LATSTRGRFLLKFSWFKIERRVVVRGTASQDDPTLGEYWWARRKVNIRHLTSGDVDLAERQDRDCPVCGGHLINGESLERRSRGGRAAGPARAHGDVVRRHGRRAHVGPIGGFVALTLVVGFLRGCREDAQKNRPSAPEIMQKSRVKGR